MSSESIEEEDFGDLDEVEVISQPLVSSTPAEFSTTELQKLGRLAGPSLPTGRCLSNASRGDYTPYITIPSTTPTPQVPVTTLQTVFSQRKDVPLVRRARVLDIVKQSVSTARQAATA